MKTATLLFMLAINASLLYGQHIKVMDSTIEIDNRLVALYKKTLNNLLPRYDYTVFNDQGQILIEAKARIYPPPVEELKSFYYYDIVFPATRDSISVFFDGTLFIDRLASFIDEYKLISKGKVDEKGQAKFWEVYDQKDIVEELEKRIEFLNEKRFLNQQVKRDRSAKIELRDNGNIFQDGKRIGYLVNYKDDERYYSRIEVFLPNNVMVAQRKKDTSVFLTNADDVKHQYLTSDGNLYVKGTSDPQIRGLIWYLISKYYL